VNDVPSTAIIFLRLHFLDDLLFRLGGEHFGFWSRFIRLYHLLLDQPLQKGGKRQLLLTIVFREQERVL
jgi:hypothetical protein